ncbi:hypothetical protein V2J09_018537, partial [Rumex salicifolius]
IKKGHEASFGCFQSKGLYYNPEYFRNFRGQPPELNNATVTKGGSTETDGNQNLVVPSQCQRVVPPQSYYLSSAPHPVFPKEVHDHTYMVGSHSYPMNHGHYISMNSRFPYVPFQMRPQVQPQQQYVQEFHYFVVIDFEATCDKIKNPHPQEIIEFPAVLVNGRTRQVEDSFQLYVRPTCNQQLSDFCKELTGIQQSQVDKGVMLSEALLMHDKWLEEKGIKNTNFAVVTWSNWDCRVMLESECRFKRIRKPPYFNRWINLKVPFCQVFGGARCNLKEAVELAGLTWEGRAHCGLDDAKNTANLLSHLMLRGFKFSITNSLVWQPPDNNAFKTQPVSHSDNGIAYQPQKWKSSYTSPFYPGQAGQIKEHLYCHCGAISVKKVFQKPGPKHGSFFFGCGNWTATRGPVCSFFKWVTTESATMA